MRPINNVVMMTLCVALGCESSTRATPPVANTLVVEPPSGETVDVVESVMERAVQVTGVLMADERAALAFQVPGRVAALQVDLGSVVKRGQSLASLDARDMELRLEQGEALLAQARARLGMLGDDTALPGLETLSQVQQAKAVLHQAEQNAVRTQEMFEKQMVAESALEASNTALEVARSALRAALEEGANRAATVRQRAAEVELARRQVAECKLLAPFDGAVESRVISPGQTIQPGVPVMTLVRINPLRARLEIPERHADSIRAQQTVRLKIDGQSGSFDGVISRLAPVIDAQARVLTVEAEVRNQGDLRPGGLVRATIVLSEDDRALTVPASAVTTFAGVDKVTVVADGKAVERVVTTGRRHADRIELLTGVKAGERVVLQRGPAGKSAATTGK